MSTDPKTDLAAIARLYEDSLALHGTASMGVGWRDEGSHLLRFEKLAYVVEGRGPITVNDLGCGYGAFLDYLTNQARVPVTLFRGYDISAEMLARARSLNPQGTYVEGSVLDQVADYSFACGIFNVRLHETEAAWLAHIERTLDNLDRYSTRGFAFNLLTTRVDYREAHLFYGDPLHFLQRCMQRYSRRVTLFHDYPLFEWTMTVRK